MEVAGDSIHALKVVALAAERGVHIDVATLFRLQTIRALRGAATRAIAWR